MMTLEVAGEILVRLVAAALCGALIGWNREREDKPAGLRTHMLVSLGAASFTLVMLDLIRRYPGSQAQGDPTRIIQGIATGIGFLGAGSIWRSGSAVKGVTTAAGIWVVGAIGVACGAGSYLIAAIAALLTLAILSVMVKLERKIPPAR
jgi:putative Mg2+ transporter-C (MgtC) family protein